MPLWGRIGTQFLKNYHDHVRKPLPFPFEFVQYILDLPSQPYLTDILTDVFIGISDLLAFSLRRNNIERYYLLQIVRTIVSIQGVRLIVETCLERFITEPFSHVWFAWDLCVIYFRF